MGETSAFLLSVTFHLTLEGFNGGIDRCQLSLQSVTPEAQHRQLAFLMMATAMTVITGDVTAERGKHVDVDDLGQSCPI